MSRTHTQFMLEHDRRWTAIRDALGSAGIGDVARQFGVTPGSIASALVRTREKRAPVVPPDEAVSRGVEPHVAAAADVDRVQVPAVTEPRLNEQRSGPAPGGKLDVHLRAYREAAATGDGPAYLLGLHRLVRSSLRAKIIRERDEALLAMFDGDAPAKRAEAERAVEAPRETLEGEALVGSTETPLGVRRAPAAPAPEPVAPPAVRIPDEILAGAVTEAVVQPVAQEAGVALHPPIRDVEPPPATRAHVYIVNLLVEGIQREYGVVGADMVAALAVVGRAGLAGSVLSVRRDREALV